MVNEPTPTATTTTQPVGVVKMEVDGGNGNGQPSPGIGQNPQMVMGTRWKAEDLFESCRLMVEMTQSKQWSKSLSPSPLP